MPTTTETKAYIKKAFYDVKKGDGIGIREAMALDDYAEPNTQEQARAQDTEEYWWDLVGNEAWNLGTALSFTDKAGFLFLLPAVMTSALDGNEDNDFSVFYNLCIAKHPYINPPHSGHPEYLEYLRSVHPIQTAKYYGFTKEQLRAIAYYFRWWIEENTMYHPDCFEKNIPTLTRVHESASKYAEPGNYTLTLDDALNIRKEEIRILTDWIRLGGINF